MTNYDYIAIPSNRLDPNPQGSSYKKSCVDLYNKEVVEVPSNYFGE